MSGQRLGSDAELPGISEHACALEVTAPKLRELHIHKAGGMVMDSSTASGIVERLSERFPNAIVHMPPYHTPNALGINTFEVGGPINHKTLLVHKKLEPLISFVFEGFGFEDMSSPSLDF